MSRIAPFRALVLLLLAAAGPARAEGEAPKSFAICSVCHKVSADQKNGIGPNLFGVGKRIAGTMPGYTYSPAMKASKIRWTKAQLIGFIAAPATRVLGTKMIYPGQKNPAEAAAIADWLLRQK